MPDMLNFLDFDVPQFLHLMRRLREIEHDCHVKLQGNEASPPTFFGPAKADAMQCLSQVRAYAVALGLDAAIAALDRFTNRQFMQNIGSPDVREVESGLGDIRRRIEDQLRGKRFMYMPKELAAYWHNPSLFGQQVAQCFPELATDIEEAGNCLAVGRYTATVFHLMRVMEGGVRRFAAYLNVDLTGCDTWGQILRRVDDAIGDRIPQDPAARAKHQRDSELAAYLRHVKDAWRNETMHPKAVYVGEEAEEIHRSTKTFMRKLAEAIT